MPDVRKSQHITGNESANTVQQTTKLGAHAIGNLVQISVEKKEELQQESRKNEHNGGPQLKLRSHTAINRADFVSW